MVEAVSSRFSSPFSRRQLLTISSPLCPTLLLKVTGDKGQPYKTACQQKGQRTSPHKAHSILMTTVTKKAEGSVLSEPPRFSNTQPPLSVSYDDNGLAHCYKLRNRGWGWLGFFLSFWYWTITDYHCCDSFRWRVKGLNHTYTCIHFPQTPLPSGSHITLSRDPCAIH